jgi:hypothetical protein
MTVHLGFACGLNETLNLASVFVGDRKDFSDLMFIVFPLKND